MRTSSKIAGAAILVALMSSLPAAERLTVPTLVGPSLSSIGTLAFNADGTLYAADPQAATIFAVDLGSQAQGGLPGAKDIAGIDQKIAAILGTEARQIAITDLAVHPKSHNAFVAVMRGQGTGAQPALLRIDGAGKVDLIATDTMKFTSLTLPNPANVSPNGRGGRTESITDMAYLDGRLYIAGLSNEEFASKLYSVAYPFMKADNGTSVEIFHGSHGRLETRSPVYTFIAEPVNGQPSLIAGYLCTPLVRIPVADLKPGSKIMGTTIAELGAGNRPIDMVQYKKDGKEFLLMANTSRGVMKIPTAQFGSTPSITAPVAGTAGIPYETIATLKGVQQLDLLDSTHSLVLAQADGALNLQVVDLP